MNKLDLNSLFDHYNILCSARENYMKSYTNTNFYFGLEIGLFALGMWKIQSLFVFIPYLILIQYSIVQWNQYHQFYLEMYLSKIEDILNGHKIEDTEKKIQFNYYSFYNKLFNYSVIIKKDHDKTKLIKPTALLVATLSLVNLPIFFFSLWRGVAYFHHTYLGVMENLKVQIQFTYFIVAVLTLYILIRNFLKMPKSIKPLLENIYSDYCDKIAT